MNEIAWFVNGLKGSLVPRYHLKCHCMHFFFTLCACSNSLFAASWNVDAQEGLDDFSAVDFFAVGLQQETNTEWASGSADGICQEVNGANQAQQVQPNRYEQTDCWDCNVWTDAWGPVCPGSYGETGYCDCNPADGYGFCDPTDPYGRLRRYGIAMPECPVLFKPLMADPRQVCYSAGWRFDDWVFVKNISDVSFADSYAIYRWCNVFFWQDALQVDLEGGIWAIFDPLHESSPLINADYYVGIPLTYRLGPFSARLRGYHISSHIGDEFLLNHPLFCRLNPSAEYLELCLSYQITPQFRVYAGFGVILQRDISFPFKRTYLEWGAETYFPFWQFYSVRDNVSGAPFFAMHFRSREDNDFCHDATYVLGYEFAKHSGLCRKLRFFLEYHQGFSVEGQFSRFKTNYFALRASYGF